MSKINLDINKLIENDAWEDFREKYAGGYEWRGERAIEKIKYIVIHHTAGTGTRNAAKDVAQIASNHIDTRKWGGIGYNLLVTSEEVNGYAKVAYVGDVGSVRAHTPNLKGAFGIPQRQGNVYLLGLAVVGNFVDKIPTDAQLRTIHEICKHMIYKDGRFKELKDWESIKSHKDFDSTACPGNFDAFKGKIITPPAFNAPDLTEYEKALKEAQNWNSLVGQRYSQKIMNVVDDRNISRNDLLVVLHRFAMYIKNSPNV